LENFGDIQHFHFEDCDNLTIPTWQHKLTHHLEAKTREDHGHNEDKDHYNAVNTNLSVKQEKA
jgi:hypothetical protein